MRVESLPAYEALFEERHRPTPAGYETAEGEIRAVHEGRKALAYYPWNADAIDCGDERLAAMHELARSLGLSVLLMPGRRTEMRVYIAKPEQLWRAWAIEAQREIVLDHGPWSDGAVALEGFLLGYTEEERAAWCEYKRWRRVGWQGETLFFFLTHEQVEALATVANRAFLPGAFAGGAVGVSPRGGRVLRRDYHGRVPDNRRIVRAAVEREALRFLFYPRSPGEAILPIGFELNGDDAATLNTNLLSPIQILVDLHWT